MEPGTRGDGGGAEGVVGVFCHPFVEISAQFALYVRMSSGHPGIAYDQQSPHQFIGATEQNRWSLLPPVLADQKAGKKHIRLKRLANYLSILECVLRHTQEVQCIRARNKTPKRIAADLLDAVFGAP